MVNLYVKLIRMGRKTIDDVPELWRAAVLEALGEEGYRTMSELRVIERLEQMLHLALEIIDEQSALLNQHGIETDSGKLEAEERRFREDMEKWC